MTTDFIIFGVGCLIFAIAMVRSPLFRVMVREIFLHPNMTSVISLPDLRVQRFPRER